MKRLLLILCLAPLFATAQTDLRIQFDWDKLAANAKERVEVNLDGALLQAIGGFLSDNDHDAAQAKRILSKLKGVYVHSYQYASDQHYSDSDIDAIREQLHRANWNRIVQSIKKDQGENDEVYLNLDTTSGSTPGLVILSAEPREFTVVHIAGRIDPQDLDILDGRFGIPKGTARHAKEKQN